MISDFVVGQQEMVFREDVACNCTIGISEGIVALDVQCSAEQAAMYELIVYCCAGEAPPCPSLTPLRCG